MCGIAGALARDGAGLAERMSRALAHRGPDSCGTAVLTAESGDVHLVHRRLAILDVSALGSQPMRSTDERFSIVFNGEIYNFAELRAGLEQEGVAFRSHSDTEVLLAGWIRHGVEFLRRLRGMYAFAIWDGARRRGVIARDAFGIKPLYLWCGGGRVLFASEIRALLATGIVERRLSAAGLAGYLAYGSVPEPHTIIERVSALPAGHLAELVDTGSGFVLSAAQRFDSLVPARATDPPRSTLEATTLVRETLADSVRSHLVSDVPVGLFLSGGIDSSALVALATQVAGQGIDSFTVTFGEREFDETGPAHAVARRFGTRHHDVPLTGDDMLEALPAAFGAMDQPSTDGLNTWLVSRAVRQHGVKVVLSGLGGDELFAGYPSFRRALTIAPLWRTPRFMREAASASISRLGWRGEKMAAVLSGEEPARAAYEASRSLFGPRQLRRLIERAAVEQARPAAPEGLSALQRVSWYELTGYMRDTLLRDSDVFSMAHGLELRVPFIDREVVRVAMSIPDRLKLEGESRSKPLLVAALQDLLPREVWDRPKQGFTLPFARWLRGALREHVERELLESSFCASGLSVGEVRAVWRGFNAGRVSWTRPWALYVLARWMREHAIALAELPDDAPMRLSA